MRTQSSPTFRLSFAWQIKMIEKGKWVVRAYGTKVKAALPAAFVRAEIIRGLVRYSVQADDQVCLQAAEPEPMPLSGPTA